MVKTGDYYGLNRAVKMGSVNLEIPDAAGMTLAMQAAFQGKIFTLCFILYIIFIFCYNSKTIL